MIQRLIYSILYSIVLIFLLPFQYRKRPKDFRQRWLKEKFGFFESAAAKYLQTSGLANSRASKLIWIHAVSVGEVTAAMPFLFRLKEKFPSANLIVSTITDTGQRIAIEKTPNGTKVIYLPFDLIFILKRTLKNLRPSIFITMETEIWPNLFRTFKNEGIPVIMMNGRISNNSYKGYKKIRFFMKDIILCVDFFGMQEPVYAERIKALGAPDDKVKILGNFKFDTMPPENIPEWTKLLAPPIIIAGSTHRGEEDIILTAYAMLKKTFPELNLIIAPRHPERFDEVKDLVKSSDMHYIKRSKLRGQVSACECRTLKGQIIILDAVGELAAVYSACDIAIIGGSFIEHGGQNLLEPAYWSKPIICGPHMENFPFAREFYEENAAIETNRTGLYERLKDLLEFPEKQKFLGKNAKELYSKKSGAVDRAIKEIEGFLDTPY